MDRSQEPPPEKRNVAGQSRRLDSWKSGHPLQNLLVQFAGLVILVTSQTGIHGDEEHMVGVETKKSAQNNALDLFTRASAAPVSS